MANLNFFSILKEDDCTVKVCGLTDPNGVLQVPDTDCTDINLTLLKAYEIKVENLCETASGIRSVCKTPVPTIALSGCALSGTFSFAINFSTDTGNTITKIEVNDVDTGSTAFPLSVTGFAIEQENEYAVTHTDTCGNTWLTEFTVRDSSGDPPGAVPACGTLEYVSITTSKDAATYDPEIDDAGCITIDRTYFGSTGPLEDGVYAITVTMKYLDGTTSKSYFEIQGVLVDCDLECQVNDRITELITDKNYEDATALGVGYEVLKNVIRCNLSRSCTVWSYVQGLLTDDGCNC